MITMMMMMVMVVMMWSASQRDSAGVEQQVGEVTGTVRLTAASTTSTSAAVCPWKHWRPGVQHSDTTWHWQQHGIVGTISTATGTVGVQEEATERRTW